MSESTSEPENGSKCYEIGYLLVPSLPEEKIGEQTAVFSDVLAKYSATVIAEEAPSLTSLAYEMDKSSGGGTHRRFTQGYFGWIKFFCSPSLVEAVRKSFEQNPHVLRVLATSTVREKTYLGKRAKQENKLENKAEEKPAKLPAEAISNSTTEAAPAPDSATAPLTAAEIVEVDKSIDEMVKGA